MKKGRVLTRHWAKDLGIILAEKISRDLLSLLSGFIAKRAGLYFSENRWREFERGIVAASREFGFDNPEQFGQWLLHAELTGSQIETLAGYLTVGETYFFRDTRLFEILEQTIIPELIAKRFKDKYLRIWSAGCSTGEEPYSIAILLNRFPGLRDWNVTILATDINPRSLQKALNGVYTEWSFRGTPEWVKKGYFKKRDDGLFEIRRDMRKAVTFSVLNLAEDSYPSVMSNTNAMDIIICRNVLMYLTEDAGYRVTMRLGRSLVDQGWLIVSPSETSRLHSAVFDSVNFVDATLYRKDSIRHREAEIPYYPEAVSGPLFMPGVPDAAKEPAASVEVSEEISPLQPQPLEASRDLKAYYEKALRLFEYGRYAESVAMLEDMLSFSSGVEAFELRDQLSLLIRSYANQGRLEDALNWCGRAIASDKMNPHFYFLRATVLQEQNLIEQAVSDLNRALYLSPDFLPAHFTLGNIMLRQGNAEKSKKYFENALEFLSVYPPDKPIEECGGITAGRLTEFINSVVRAEVFV